MLNDLINHPEHYTSGGIECIDAMVSTFGVDAVRTYCTINAFKYLWRCNHKGTREQDIQKARWYLDKEIELGQQTCRKTGGKK